MAFFGSDEKSISDIMPVTEIEGLKLQRTQFIATSTRALYSRIIYAVLKEIQASEKQEELITLSASDNYSPFARGYVHFVSDAMTKRKHLYIKKLAVAENRYSFTDKDISEKDKESADVFELDFRHFEQAELIKEIYGMLYDALNGASRGVKISQALLIKVARLSEMMADARQTESVEAQLQNIADGLKEGKAAYCDAGSSAEFASFDTDPTEKQIQFCLNMLSNITGFAASFFNGIGGSAMSDTGESDKKQNRTAIEFYFLSVIQSVLESIFKETFKLKPVLENMEILPTMLSTIEMWGEGSEAGKQFLYEQVGLRKEHIDLSEKEPVAPIQFNPRAVGGEES